MKAAELKGFSETAYYQSDPGLMLGDAAGWVATLLVRPLGAGGFTFIGNYDAANNAGWNMGIACNPLSAQATLTLGFTVFEGGVQLDVGADIAAVMGQVLAIHVRYVQGSTARIFAQGARMVSVASAAAYDIPSGTRFGIGNNPQNVTNLGDSSGFLGFGYAALASCTEANIIANTNAMMQAGKIVSAGLTAPYAYMYDAVDGAAATLVNKGDGGSAPLSRVGAPTVGPTEFLAMTPVVIGSVAGGGGSGEPPPDEEYNGPQPAAFAPNQWDLVNPTTGGALDFVFHSLPNDFGNTITEFQYKNGSADWESFDPAIFVPGTRRVNGLTDGDEYGMRVRAVNDAGAGSGGTTKFETPSSVTPDLTSLFQVVSGPNHTLGGGDTNTYELGTGFVAEITTQIWGCRIFNAGEVDRPDRSMKLWGTTLTNATTMVLLAEAALPNQLDAGWSEHLFDIPITVYEGMAYVVSYDVGDGVGEDLRYASNPGVFSDGVITMTSVIKPGSGNLRFGCYSTTPDTVPNTYETNSYGIEPLRPASVTPMPSILLDTPTAYAPGRGMVQPDLNINGRVRWDAYGVRYRVNGGSWSSWFAVGPNGRRLVRYGEFVLVIPFSDLDSGDNTIDVQSGDSVLTPITSVSLTVTKPSATVAPGVYFLDGDATPTDGVFTTIDGKWQLDGVGAGLRSPAPPGYGYDRIFGLIGPVEEGELEGRIKFLKLDSAGWAANTNSGDYGGVAIIFNWPGHNDTHLAGDTPPQGFVPLGGMVWLAKFEGESGDITSRHGQLYDINAIGGDAAFGPASMLWGPIDEGPSMSDDMRFRARKSIVGGNPRYQLKVWNAVGGVEPISWQMDITDTDNTTHLTGGIVLVNHFVDARYSELKMTVTS